MRPWLIVAVLSPGSAGLGARTVGQVFRRVNASVVIVQRVAAQSPAAQAGLRGGSLRVSINGETLTVGGDAIPEVQGLPITGRSSYEAIQTRLSQLHPGIPITITVLRSPLGLVGYLP